MKWQQVSEKPPPPFENKAIAFYDDGSKQMLGFAVVEYKHGQNYICFDTNQKRTFEYIQGHPELSFVKWLDESQEADHLVSLIAMFVRELIENSLITEAQLVAILNYMQNK